MTRIDCITIKDSCNINLRVRETLHKSGTYLLCMDKIWLKIYTLKCWYCILIHLSFYSNWFTFLRAVKRGTLHLQDLECVFGMVPEFRKTSNSCFEVISLSIFSSHWLSCRGFSSLENQTKGEKCLAAILSCPDKYSSARRNTSLIPPAFTFPVLRR